LKLWLTEGFMCSFADLREHKIEARERIETF